MYQVRMGSRQFYLNLRKELGLTDVQVKELQQIRLDHVARTVDIQGDLRVVRIELADLLENDSVKMNYPGVNSGVVHSQKVPDNSGMGCRMISESSAG